MVDDMTTIELNPIPSSSERSGPNFSVIDDELFLPVIKIDPIYSGTAEYGASVSLTMRGKDGGYIATREVLADAAGQWIAIFPQIEAGGTDNEFDEFYGGTRLFDDPTGILPDFGRNGLLNLPEQDRIVRVGSFLTDDPYSLQIAEDASPIAGGSGNTFNSRVYYAPSSNHELFVGSETLDVSEVFEDTAQLTVERLHDAALNPLAFGLNRFNAEFLTISATPGAN